MEGVVADKHSLNIGLLIGNETSKSKKLWSEQENQELNCSEFKIERVWWGVREEIKK